MALGHADSIFEFMFECGDIRRADTVASSCTLSWSSSPNTGTMCSRQCTCSGWSIMRDNCADFGTELRMFSGNLNTLT